MRLHGPSRLAHGAWWVGFEPAEGFPYSDDWVYAPTAVDKLTMWELEYLHDLGEGALIEVFW